MATEATPLESGCIKIVVDGQEFTIKPIPYEGIAESVPEVVGGKHEASG